MPTQPAGEKAKPSISNALSGTRMLIHEVTGAKPVTAKAILSTPARMILIASTHQALMPSERERILTVIALLILANKIWLSVPP
jgi:hypothetical protein